MRDKRRISMPHRERFGYSLFSKREGRERERRGEAAVISSEERQAEREREKEREHANRLKEEGRPAWWPQKGGVGRACLLK